MSHEGWVTIGSVLSGIAMLIFFYCIAYGNPVDDFTNFLERRRSRDLQHEERMLELQLKIEKEKNRQLNERRDYQA